MKSPNYGSSDITKADGLIYMTYLKLYPPTELTFGNIESTRHAIGDQQV